MLVIHNRASMSRCYHERWEVGADIRLLAHIDMRTAVSMRRGQTGRVSPQTSSVPQSSATPPTNRCPRSPLEIHCGRSISRHLIIETVGGVGPIGDLLVIGASSWWPYRLVAELGKGYWVRWRLIGDSSRLLEGGAILWFVSKNLACCLNVQGRASMARHATDNREF